MFLCYCRCLTFVLYYVNIYTPKSENVSDDVNQVTTSTNNSEIMKSIQIAVIIFFTTFFTSCIRFVDAETGQPLGQRGGGGQPQYQQGGKTSLTPFYPGQKPSGRVQTGTKQVRTGTKKTEIARFEARLWGSDDAGMKHQAASWAARYFEKNRRIPSNEEVSRGVGFKCQVRRIDGGQAPQQMRMQMQPHEQEVEKPQPQPQPHPHKFSNPTLVV